MGNKELFAYVYSVNTKLELKEIRKSFSAGSAKRIHNGALEVELADKKIVHIYDYGSVAFINVAEDEHSDLLEKIGLISDLRRFRAQNEEFSEDDFIIRVKPDVLDVAFNSVTIPEWNIDYIRIIAEVLARSSALEIVQWEVEERLNESERMSDDFGGFGFNFLKRRKVLSFIADGLRLRHRVENHLSLFNEPDLIWDDEALNKFYEQLQDQFEIECRVKRIQEMLELSRDVSMLQLEMLNTKRSEILEIIIIILIAIEVVRLY